MPKLVEDTLSYTTREHMVTKDDDDDEGLTSKPKIIIEDLGGAPADLDEEAHPNDATASKHELQMTTSIIKRVLSRTAERDTAGQVGRPKDMHKEMQRVAAIFGTEIDDAIKPFHIQPHENKAFGITIHEALQHQKSMAETLRQQQDTGDCFFCPRSTPPGGRGTPPPHPLCPPVAYLGTC